MSREQRRLDRRQQTRAGGGRPSSRTPVRAPSGGGGVPWMPIGVAAAVVLLVLLIGYLIVQASGDDTQSLSDSEKAEQDASSDLPGVFVPTQGRGHFNYTFSLDRTPKPFCPGVRASDPESVLSEDGTPASSGTAAATPTPGAATTGTAASGTSASGTAPAATPTVRTDCYSSNPPSSGQHLGVQRNVDVTGNGDIMNIPADPDVYPDDIVTPREAIPHILEHAGVFVGWNCEDGDDTCLGVVEELKDLVNDRIDNHDDRVVMARDPDLPVGEMGVASWTRVMNFTHEEYDEGAVEDFIGTHACRFDPEGFC